jgi:hypothetical protein
MGFSKPTIIHALNEADNNQIKVAYQLVIDKRQMGLSQSPPAWNSKLKTQMEKLSQKNSSIQILSSSVSKVSLESQAPKSAKPRAKWHYGIRSRSDPLDVMLELYRAIQSVGMTWKTIDTFHIRCKYLTNRGQEIKMDILLYAIEKQNYLVDFKALVSGSETSRHYSTFGFFEACTCIIKELAISG